MYSHSRNGKNIRRLFGPAAAFTILAGVLGLALVDASPAYPPGSDQTVPAVKELSFEMRKQAPKILDRLRERGYQNVGVLKFRAQIDNRKPTFHAGRLNQQMATRMENALILAMKDSDTIGITRSAAFAAAKQDRKSTYVNADGREQLFKRSYPLAWGEKPTAVKVDAFVTGLVTLNTKTRIGEVRVQMFDRNNANKPPEIISTFQFRMNANTLAESGQRYVVARQVLQKAGSVEDIDDAAQTPPNPGKVTQVDNELEKVLNFTMCYDGKDVTTAPDAATGYLNCEPPPTGSKEVLFKLKASEKIGLVLFVNGVNTLMMEKAPDRAVDQHARWVLEPGEEYTIRGFYPDFKQSYPFKVVPPDGIADPGDLGPEDKWGLIELTMFRAADNPNVQQSPSGDNLQNPNLKADDPRNLKSLLSKANKAKAKNLIVFDKAGAVASEVKEVTFNAVQGAGLTIKYFDKAAAPNPNPANP